VALLFQALPALAVWMWTRPVRTLSAGTRIAAALGLGLGLSSALFFLWRLAGGSTATFVIVDPALWALACLAALALSSTSAPAGTHTQVRNRWPVALALLALAVVGASAAKAWLQLEASPFGDWDAWAIWNLRARFLAHPSPLWRNAFTEELAWTHPDYPLLLPASVARGWVLDSAISMRVPIVLATVFTAATVALVAASLYERRGAAGAVLGLSLLLVPAFILNGVSQLADVPLGFFIVLAVVLLAARPSSAATLGLAGLAMGMAAWTKNEGLVVAGMLPCLYVLLVFHRSGLATAHGAATDIIVGLGPMLVVLALFKIFLAPDNELVSGLQRPGVLTYWSDQARVSFIARYMTNEGAWWGGWLVLSPMLLIPVVALAPTGLRRDRSAAVTAAGMLIIGQLAVFFAIYVMTPYGVAWHTESSWSRLVAQMWPTIVWWACARQTSAL